MMFKFILVFAIVVNYAQGDWKLVWNDEFDGNHLDFEYWNVTNGVKDNFETPFREEMVYNYPLNRTKNILVKEGVVALNAYREMYKDRDFTGASITLLVPILYGRLDIRAALPEGKLLKTVFVLIPKDRHYGPGNENGIIEILVDLQRTEFHSSIYYDKKMHQDKTHNPRLQLNDFQNYSIEWSKTQLTLRLNDMIYLSRDLTKNLSSLYSSPGQPFDKEFYLSLRLQVYTSRKTEFKSASFYHNEWKCPSLLIDHVRYYKQVSDEKSLIDQSLLKNTNVTRTSICEMIKSEFYVTNDEQGRAMSDIILKIIIPICVLIILFFVIYCIYRRRVIRNNQENGVYQDYVYKNYENNYLKIFGFKQEDDEIYDETRLPEIYDQVYDLPNVEHLKE